MKKIVKLVVKSACVMLPMIFIYAFTWTKPLHFMDEEAPHYLWNREKVHASEDHYYDTIILGDSMANAAYMPEILSDSTINLALGGMTPVENYYVLLEWLETHTAPKVCYLSFQDAHLQMEDCFWTRTMYSHRFGPRQNIEILKAAKIYHEPTIIIDNYQFDFLAYELRLPNKYIASFMNSGLNQRYERNVESQQRDELHRGRYVGRGVEEYVESNKILVEEFYINPLFEDYYRRLIQLCLEHGIQVRIFKLPHPENVSFTEEYIVQFEQYYDRLKQDYQGITVDWIMTYERSWFVDPNHLNSYGALKLSEEIRERYSEDFDSVPLSPEQVAALNDSLEEENRAEHLPFWIEGKDYTLVIKRGDQVYSISGLDNRKQGTVVFRLDNGQRVYQEDDEMWQWELPENGDLAIAVIDNYNQQTVCTKSFRYINQSYLLAE